MSVYANIKALWKFNESSGNATDSVNGAVLTNTNTVTYATGKVANGSDLEGSSSQYFTMADTAPLSVTGDLTIAFWMKPETASSDPVFVDKTVYYVQIDMTSHFVKFANTNGGGSANAQVTIPTMSAGTWYHIAVVYTASTGGLDVYFNGVSQGTASGLRTSISDSADAFVVGRYQAGASNYYDGMLDELGVWAEALVSGDITAIYDAGNGGVSIYNSVSVSDTLTLTDTITTLGSGIVSVSETVTLSDSVKAEFGWSTPTKHTTTWTNSQKSQ